MTPRPTRLGLAEGCGGPDRGERSDCARRLRPRVSAGDIRRALSTGRAAPPIALGALEAALAPVVGGVSLQFDAVPVLALGNTALKPEQVDSFELGYSGVVQRQWLFTMDVTGAGCELHLRLPAPGGHQPWTDQPAVWALPAAVLVECRAAGDRSRQPLRRAPAKPARRDVE